MRLDDNVVWFSMREHHDTEASARERVELYLCGWEISAALQYGGRWEVPEHYHPHQEERFVVISGKMGVRAAGRERVLGPGEEVVVPPGTPHTFWNAGEEELHHVVELRPARNMETFFETIFGLQRDGRFPVEGEKRPPNLLQGALIVTEYENYLSRPPILVQKIVFRPLAFLGHLLGYQASYAEYSGERVKRSE